MGAPKGFLVVPIGFRADGTLRTLELTDNDELKIALATATAGLVAPHGWYLDDWYKQPLQIGISECYAEQVGEVCTNIVTHKIDTAIVAPGKLHVYTIVGLQDYHNACTLATFYVKRGATNIDIAYYAPTVAQRPDIWSGQIVLKEGDYIQANFKGATINDDLYVRILGYQMDLET